MLFRTAGLFTGEGGGLLMIIGRVYLVIIFFVLLCSCIVFPDRWCGGGWCVGRGLGSVHAGTLVRVVDEPASGDACCSFDLESAEIFWLSIQRRRFHLPSAGERIITHITYACRYDFILSLLLTHMQHIIIELFRGFTFF